MEPREQLLDCRALRESRAGPCGRALSPLLDVDFLSLRFAAHSQYRSSPACWRVQLFDGPGDDRSPRVRGDRSRARRTGRLHDPGMIRAGLRGAARGLAAPDLRLPRQHRATAATGDGFRVDPTRCRGDGPADRLGGRGGAAMPGAVRPCPPPRPRSRRRRAPERRTECRAAGVSELWPSRGGASSAPGRGSPGCFFYFEKMC